MSRARAMTDRPHPWRRGAVLGGWLLCVGLVIARAGQIQVVQGDRWKAKANDQHTDLEEVAAPRGAIYDRGGSPLSVTRDQVRVNIAPNEVRNHDALQGALVAGLGLSATRARQHVMNERRWNVVGLFAPSVREQFAGFSGVHLDQVFQRYSPARDLARGVLGVVIDDEGRGGVERIYDHHLRGTPGSRIVRRNNLGTPIPGDRVIVQAPQAGGQVVVTIDSDLQEIAQAALLEAIDKHEALGGDILITNPFSGEILALFSTRDGHNGALSAVNSPFEPGSTLKPFTVAGLLDHDLATMRDTVDAESGRWQAPGRILTDTHTEGWMTLREALRESSNIGIAKMAQLMSPGVQYENLRNFGFGTLTGVELPGEVAGTLRRPDRWSALSPASLAIGYEVSVTPLQMAMAYGALANGGLLMQPRLIREVRAADGSVLEAFDPLVVRRVVAKETAHLIGGALEDVVTTGTGSLAQLGSFRVAGKSGTARFSSNGGYSRGDYSSSFVGYFPADKPQLVVFVKLDRPQDGTYYGGAVAAPVTRMTMEAALAAAPPAIRLGALVNSQGRNAAAPSLAPQFTSGPMRALPPLESDWDSEEDGSAESSDGPVRLPELSGLPSRRAILNLHRFGLRAAHAESGEVIGTIPVAGTLVMQGDTIRLRYRGQTYE
jgi:cell division protein FtsI (penicillin-binding protein 3)